jgi:multiple sugar transport system substrate-binding protein
MISRRRFLQAGAGLAGLAGLGGAALAAERLGLIRLGSGERPLTVGSNYSDEVPRAAMEAVVDAFTSRTGIDVRMNIVDPRSFQERIGTYLQATPDDVFTWFAGYRMRFFADRGLASDVSGVWRRIGSHYSDAERVAATGSDGRQYLVPFVTYPWPVIYRRSTWHERGYSPPTTLGRFIDLCRRMESDGLVPIAFGNRDGWPAMGYFDILNLRLNGYDFHLSLLDGRQRWSVPRVAAVFETWRELLPYLQRGALGRTWQEAARSMLAGEAGMIFLGTMAAEQATPPEREDLEIFHFPVLGTDFDNELALDAPINGFMLSKSPAQQALAEALLEWLGSGAAQTIFVDRNPSRIAVARDASAAGYTRLQRRMAELIASSNRLAQFFDRDTRPDFAGPQGMQSFLNDFLDDPGQDITALLDRIQAYWDSLPD